MTESLYQLDLSIFLAINHAHTPFLDKLMWLTSGRLTWIPLYLIFIWMLYRKYRKDLWIILIFIAVMILASDQLCNLAKNSVMRLRPSHEPGLSSMIHVVQTYTGGMYGFYSAHASNAFAVALFMILTRCVRNKTVAGLLIIWAFLIGYSRIYLGVHYPSDVLTGIIMGSGISALITWLMNKTLNLKNRKKVTAGQRT